MGPVNPTTISHDASIEFTDGTPIPPGTLTKYQYGFGLTASALTLIKDDADFTPNSEGKQTAPLSIAGQLAIGQWFAAARAVSKDGPMSPWSTAAAFEIKAKEPRAPSGFSLT